MVIFGERPELADPNGLAEATRPFDAPPVAVLDVITQSGVDPDRDAVVIVTAAVDEPHVLDTRVAERLHSVVPASAVEVIQPALPFGEQVRSDEL